MAIALTINYIVYTIYNLVQWNYVHFVTIYTFIVDTFKCKKCAGAAHWFRG